MGVQLVYTAQISCQFYFSLCSIIIASMNNFRIVGMKNIFLKKFFFVTVLNPSIIFFFFSPLSPTLYSLLFFTLLYVLAVHIIFSIEKLQ